MPDRTSRRRQSSGGDTGDRALSEVLSYAFIFSMLVVSIGIVTVGGVGALQDVRTNEHVSNAERAFDVLHDNLADVHSEGAPSRATEIALGDGQLYLDDNVTMTVETGSGTIDREIRPVVFRVAEDQRMVYVAGATLRTSRDGGVVVNDPPFLISKETVHVPIVQTTAPAVTGVGSGTVLVRGQSSNRSVAIDQAGGGDFESLLIETPRAETWEQYFAKQPFCESSSVTGTEAKCVIHDDYDDPGRLYMTVQRIDLTLIK